MSSIGYCFTDGSIKMQPSWQRLHSHGFKYPGYEPGHISYWGHGASLVHRETLISVSLYMWSILVPQFMMDASYLCRCLRCLSFTAQTVTSASKEVTSFWFIGGLAQLMRYLSPCKLSRVFQISWGFSFVVVHISIIFSDFNDADKQLSLFFRNPIFAESNWYTCSMYMPYAGEWQLLTVRIGVASAMRRIGKTNTVTATRAS